jgi:hypothetical protein
LCGKVIVVSFEFFQPFSWFETLCTLLNIPKMFSFSFHSAKSYAFFFFLHWGLNSECLTLARQALLLFEPLCQLPVHLKMEN